MKNLLKNIIASVLPQAMNILSNLILPSLIIMKYGSEINGLVSTTKSIISYISLVGAGIATAVVQALYAPVAKKEYEVVKGMLHAAGNMFNKYGLIFCGITLATAIIYPFTISADIDHITITLLLIVMSLSGASEFFVVGRCRALLYAHRKVYICSVIQAVSLLGSLVLALVMLQLDTSIVVVQFSISFVYVLRALLLHWYVNRQYPIYADYKQVAPDHNAVAKRGDALVHQISGLAINGSQSVILTGVVGLGAASIYSVYNIVFSGLQSICSNISTAITPFLGREYALGGKKQLAEKFDLVDLLFHVLVSVVYSVATMMILPFVSLYTQNADIDYLYPAFAWLFSMTSAIYVLKIPSNSLINVAGHFKETKWRAITEGAICIVLGLLFTALWGMIGVLIGLCAALLWRCIDTIIYTHKHILCCNSRKTLFRFARTVAIILFWVWVTATTTISAPNYFEWILSSFKVLLVSVIMVFIDVLLFDRMLVKRCLYSFGINRIR